MTGTTDRPSRTLLAAGFLQILAAFTPAVRVRLAGVILFVRVPTAGLVLVMLGLLSVAVALRPRGWWRWLPGVLSAVVLLVAHWRIVHAPSGTFFDPLLRHAVHPAWGFIPMAAAVLVSLAGAAVVRPAPRPLSTASAVVGADAGESVIDH